MLLSFPHKSREAFETWHAMTHPLTHLVFLPRVLAGILHRDIKPENILLVDDGAGSLGGVTLSDFGFSHQVSPKSRLACGKQVRRLSSCSGFLPLL